MNKPTILSPQLGIAADSPLGGAQADRGFLYHLAGRGYHIRLILPEGARYDAHDNVTASFIPRGFCLRHSYTANIPFAREVARILALEKIDIIRVHAPYSIGVGMACLKMKKTLPPVWLSYLHCEDRLDWRLLDSVLPRYADGITVLSEDTKQDLARRFRGLDEKLVTVTPLGIDQKVFTRHSDTEILRAHGVDEHRPVLLFVGSLIKRKGISLLMDVWGQIRRLRQDVQLVIIGTGPLKKLLEPYVAQGDLFHIPHASQKELSRWYSRANVFVFPTLKEGFGLVVGEAMSCGCPVITHDVAGVRVVVEDGTTGYCVPVGNIALFVRKILALIDDPHKACAMGEYGWQRIQDHFSWERATDKVEEFIGEMLNGYNHQ